MYIKFAIPKIRTMIFPGIFRKKKDEVHYIGGAEVLPPPLAGEDEAVCIEMLTSDESGQLARKQLIEHNLRLVVYIAKKFDNTGVGVEDLISIGTIGLIKAINTFNPGKNIKLATYASRCIENEILEECLTDFRIQLINAKNQLVPVSPLLNHLADHISLCLIPSVRCKFVNHIHQFRNILLRIFLHIL